MKPLPTKSVSAVIQEFSLELLKKLYDYMSKVRETIKSSENHPMDRTVRIDEFVIGRKGELKECVI